jgi:hypothetical protein
MYFPWNWEFGSALSKFQNFRGEPPPEILKGGPPLRYATVYVTFNRLLDQRNTWVFALLIMQLWKLFRLLKLHPIGKTMPRALNDLSAHHSEPHLVPWTFRWKWKWNCQISSQGKVLLTSVLDQSQPWGSRGRALSRGSRVGYFNRHMTLWQGLTSTQRQT